MSKLAAFLGSNSGLIAGAGVFVVGSIGVGAYLGVLAPKDATPPAVVMVAQPETAVVAVEPVESTPELAVVETQPEAHAPATQDTATAPTVDEVRNEADGLTVIAGRAEPGSDVVLLVDGIENMTVQAGNDGAFAAVTFLLPNGDAQVLTILQRTGGVDLAADDIILAPRARVVATAEPAAKATLETIEPVAEDAGVVGGVAATETAPAASVETQVEPEKVATQVEPVTEVATLEAPEPTLPETTAAPDPQTTPVPVTEQVAILKSNETGVEIINRSSAPDVMSNVAIDTISYSQNGDVLLSGRAQSQASVVRVYLNNAVVTTLEVDTKGRWRGDLPDVDTGIYTLRVDEVDDVGDVTSRVETPFKREAPAILAAAQRDVDAPVKAITVQTGATLWAIARDRYGDGTLFVRVVDANKDSIRNPDLIYPGQVFELPE
ncbi:MAG: LysM peptidoglycan-binding domain-containing protein [Ascidiaceihabitans sp.]|nr:LysM peptidoglycan-binding domain-containing protein [Ascidiaceihabitans sp.]